MARGLRIARALAHGAGYGLLVVAVLAAVLLVAGPRVAGYRTLTVLSGSMRPSMPPGALAVVRPQPLRDVRAGQVISFHPPSDPQRVVTHRVLAVVRRGAHPVVRTKGDANAVADPWRMRLQGAVAWRVTRVVPGAGWAVHLLRQPLWRWATGYLAPALWALITLLRLWRPRRASGEARATTAVVVVAVLACGARPAPAEAAWSRATAVRSSAASATVLPPTGVAATDGCDLLAPHVTVTWSPSANGLSDGYVVERKLAAQADTSYAAVATVTGGTTTTYLDYNAARLTQYAYRLRGTAKNWRSAPSSSATVNTLLC